MHNGSKIDCILFSHENREYILPLISFQEIVDAKSQFENIHPSNFKQNTFYQFTWKELEIPLLNASLSDFKIQKSSSEKIAVIQAIFSNKCQHPPYFSLYIDSFIKRKSISSKSINWFDKDNKQVNIHEQNVDITATIFDLFHFSMELEKMLSQIPKK